MFLPHTDTPTHRNTDTNRHIIPKFNDFDDVDQRLYEKRINKGGGDEWKNSEKSVYISNFCV